MFKSLTRPLIAAAILAVSGLGVAGTALAAEGNEIKAQDWGFNGMFGTYDRPAMQRGYQVYKEVCAACHALEHMSFYHLGLKNGPFYDPENPNPNDNAVVKEFAKAWDIPAIDQDTGDAITRPGIPADKFPAIFPNAIAAAASNGGAVPPDLSVITKARTGGPDYIHALLMGYVDPPQGFELDEGMTYNAAFAGHQIKMTPPLSDGMIEYAPRTVADDHGGEPHTIAPPAATVEQMSRDLVEFLTWAGDPNMEARKRMGAGTFLFLFIFAFLLFLTYKQVWKGVKH